ncbi:MAG: hypothetical protein AUG51_18070 [Acidobacteria bacterium 13_1_20CM_3_53_8]|nr:MAG: hypothetical protein AUG51_18070 [Acidobacteria bacterium 13_1_20CM_3_53_8]
MRRIFQLILLLLSISTATLAQSQVTTQDGLTAHDLLIRWRDAVHAMKLTQAKTALLDSTSNEDGVRASVYEWVAKSGAYASQNFSGTVGEGIYHRYHVFLDYARNRVIFEPTLESAKPFPERRTYGLSMLASGTDLHTYTIAAVRPGSPAEADGFKKGDVILAFDGRSAAQFTLGELREWLTHEGEATNCKLHEVLTV